MSLSHILSLALKSILVNRLQKILSGSEKICQFRELAGFAGLTDSTSRSDRLSLSKIPLRRGQSDSQIWYASAIAFRLARSEPKTEQQLTMELALEITDALNRNIVPTDATTHPLPLDRVWQNFGVQLIGTGWIYFNLSEIGLQEWLTVLSDRLPTLTQNSLFQNSLHQNSLFQNNQRHLADFSPPNPGAMHDANCSTTHFSVLYAHARCCALLRLGMQEQLIQLEQSPLPSATWMLTHPESIAWLNADQQFRCTHIAERRLIAQIVDILDELDCPPDSLSAARLWQLAHRLSQDFQTFHANCRLFGAIKTDDLALAQARFGLVLITQALLHWILQGWLHISPPIAL